MAERRMRFLGAVTAVLLVAACDALAPGLPPDDETLAGTVEGMPREQVRLHLAGDAEFARVFSPAGGLGPVFVAASCEQCHVGDAKGHPAFNLTRFGRYENGVWDPMRSLGGPQLQHRSIPGYPAELVPAAAAGVTRLTPPAITGLGFLDAVDDTTLVALADPDDADGDGISGRVQLLDPADVIENALALEGALSPDPGARGTLVEGRRIGRFGKKASTVNLLHQTVGAYREDMGITSDLLLDDPLNPAAGALASDGVPDPEVSSAVVANVVFYLKTLREPPRREATHSEVVAGEALFTRIGCAGCHVPTVRTGHSNVAVLDRRTFHPYTDLLLHDMGPELDDGYTEGRASTSEWRTPPLWGIGIQERFQGGQAFYLHDGRARTLEEAIGFHGGEGATARDAFRALPPGDRARLIRFLRSL